MLLKKQTVFSGKWVETGYHDSKLSKMDARKGETLEFTQKKARQYAINQAVSREKCPILPKKESSLIHGA